MDRRGKNAGIARNYKGKRLQGSITVPVPQANNLLSANAFVGKQALKQSVMSAGSPDGSPVASPKSNNSGAVLLQNGSTANSAMSKPYVSTFHLIPSNDLSQRISMGSWHPK